MHAGCACFTAPPLPPSLILLWYKTPVCTSACPHTHFCEQTLRISPEHCCPTAALWQMKARWCWRSFVDTVERRRLSEASDLKRCLTQLLMIWWQAAVLAVLRGGRHTSTTHTQAFFLSALPVKNPECLTAARTKAKQGQVAKAKTFFAFAFMCVLMFNARPSSVAISSLNESHQERHVQKTIYSVKKKKKNLYLYGHYWTKSSSCSRKYKPV